MHMLDALVVSARPDKRERLADQIYNALVNTSATVFAWPLLPKGWGYECTHGTGGVGASNAAHDIVIMATCSYNDGSDESEVAFEVTFTDCTMVHETRTLPVVDFKHWHALLFHLCQRFTNDGVVLQASGIYRRESPPEVRSTSPPPPSGTSSWTSVTTPSRPSQPRPTTKPWSGCPSTPRTSSLAWPAPLAPSPLSV